VLVTQGSNLQGISRLWPAIWDMPTTYSRRCWSFFPLSSPLDKVLTQDKSNSNGSFAVGILIKTLFPYSILPKLSDYYCWLSTICS